MFSSITTESYPSSPTLCHLNSDRLLIPDTFSGGASWRPPSSGEPRLQAVVAEGGTGGDEIGVRFQARPQLLQQLKSSRR